MIFKPFNIFYSSKHIQFYIEKVFAIYTLYLMFLYVSKSMRFSTRRWHILLKKGFTIWEILIVIVVISIGLLSVIAVLNNGLTYVQKTRQKVIALNLAREGMEAVYQMRDTNRTRWAWVKDQCWLKIDPMTDEWALRCIDDTRFSTWSYVLEYKAYSGQYYFALTWPQVSFDLSDGLDTGDLYYGLCQTWGLRYSCIAPNTTEGKYFREIQWLWLYLKDVPVTWWTLIPCTWSLSNPDCWSPRAKEFRFCSKVYYIGDGTGEVKLCWVLTNFKGK